VDGGLDIQADIIKTATIIKEKTAFFMFHSPCKFYQTRWVTVPTSIVFQKAQARPPVAVYP
jgi:hypothetical protein